MTDTHERHCCTEYKSVSRRTFLGGATAASVAAALGYSWLPRVAFAQTRGTRDVIVSVFLRGGADGCSICVPHGDAGYYAARPTIAVPKPGSGQSGAATDLNGFFGFPQAMLPLLPAYQNGHLAIVHAVGSPNWSRSHFDAQKWMEISHRNDINDTSGWLGRHLATSTEMLAGAPMRAVGLDWGGLSRTLAGGPKTLPIPDPDNFGFTNWMPDRNEINTWLANQYNRVQDMTKQAARDTRNVIATLDRIDFDGYHAGGGAVYPDTYFARSLKATAAMIRANIGLEASHINFEGWDTHSDQDPVGGYMRNHMGDLAQALGAFYKDLFAVGRTDFTLVVMSEFGRNVLENGSRGTDHGAGNCMLVMGGKVNGGQVYGSWPGCGANKLLDGYDLQMTTDYRAVLSEIVKKRLGNNNLTTVFPDYTPQFLNVCQA